MGLFKKRKTRETHTPVKPEPAPSGDPRLPGSAGYRGIASMPKHGMPQSRFNYVRPDGKSDA